MRLLICIVFTLCFIEMNAQNDSILKFKDRLSYYSAYSGNNIFNPGLKFGLDYNIYSKIKQKNKGNKIKTRNHHLKMDGNLGFYWDPKSQIGVYTNYGLVYTKTHTKGFQYQIGLNPIGYYRSFLPETYEVTDDWEVKKVTLPGRNYYAPTFLIGIGKTRKGKQLNSWFLNINSMLLVPYNSRFMPLFYLEYGYRFNFQKR